MNLERDISVAKRGWFFATWSGRRLTKQASSASRKLFRKVRTLQKRGVALLLKRLTPDG